MPSTIDLGVVAAFAALWVVIVPTPGPNSLMVTHLALTRSPSYVALAIAGNVLGILALALAALFGIAVVMQLFPWFRLAIHVLGGLYLILLGARLLRRSMGPAAPQSSTRQEDAGRGESGRHGFLQGFTTAVSNTQAVIFITSFFAATGALAASLPTGLACVAVIVVLNCLYLSGLGWLFQREAPRRFYARSRRILDGTVGVLFLALGIRVMAKEIVVLLGAATAS